MPVSTITQAAGTVKGTTLVGLLYQLCMLGHSLQSRHNRAKPKFKKNDIVIDFKFDGDVTTMTAAINLQGQRVEVDGQIKPELKLDSDLSQYIVDDTGALVAWSGGDAGDYLEGTMSYEEAILAVAERVSLLESRIEPDLLLKEVNIVNTSPDPENGAVALSVSIPMRNGFDAAAGTSAIAPKNYLWVLDADNEAI
jgi:hypothetical protein